jgi:serine/threonine protein kinase
MQLVPSRTLGSIVREEGPLPHQRVAEISMQLLAALRVAHAAGVLHRDVKPDNVLITDDGHAVLTDFGIAAMEDDSPVTHTGMLVGTPPFIAPERASGGRATQASDLWSLGVTMYFAVEARSPFERGHALATLTAVLHDQPGQLHRAGPLGAVIEGLLIKDSARRLTAGDAARRLRAVAEGRTAQPLRSTVPAPAWLLQQPVHWRTRPDIAVGIGAMAVLIAVAVGGIAYVTARTPGSTAEAMSTPTVTVFKTFTAQPESLEVPSTPVTPSKSPAIQPATAPPEPSRKQKPPKDTTLKTAPDNKGRGKGKKSHGHSAREDHKSD